MGVAPHVASAQLATTATTTATTAVPTSTVTCSMAATTPTVTQTDQFAPIRFVGTQNLGTTTRPVSQNQTGISYQDCISDQVLQFSVQACGFLSGADNLEVWVSNSADCTAATDRGKQGGIAQCWPVLPPMAIVAADNTQTIQIHVRDIVAHQADSPPPTVYSPAGIAACSTQQSFSQISFNINFVPVNVSNGTGDGTAYQYPIIADMVGPPAPVNLTVGRGDTLLTTNWTANLDTDTTGYDVIIDPLPGQGTPGSSNSNNIGTSTTVLVCSDAGEDASDDGAVSDAEVSDAEVSDAAASDATSSTDATVDASADATTSDGGVPAGCHLVSVANTNNSTNSMCSDTLLTSGVINDGGGTSTTTEVPTNSLDGAADAGDAETTVVATGGGIYIPPAGHVLNLNPNIGSTVTGGTSSTFLVKGLLDGVNYNVVIAAVDNFGNVGPPSGIACGIPAPVNDFWKDYRNAGGQAGGGFCALEAVGTPAGSTVAFGAFGALVVAGFRRRRDRRSGRRS